MKTSHRFEYGHTHSQIEFRSDSESGATAYRIGGQQLLAGFCLMLLLGPAVAAEAPASRPPVLSASALQQKLVILQQKGRLISMEYDAGKHFYRLQLLTPQGQLLRYTFDPRTGKLMPLLAQNTHLTPAVGLLSLEALVQKVFGQQPCQLLEAELKQEHGRFVYELEWLQQGQFHKAHFDARSGALIQREH